MITEKRLWRTTDGGELVLDDHPEASLLAYGEGDEVAGDDEAAAKKALAKSNDKKAPAPRDKKQAPPANKSKK